MVMLYFAAASFVLSLMSAIVGFSGLFADATETARALFFVFLVIGSILLICGRKVPV